MKGARPVGTVLHPVEFTIHVTTRGTATKQVDSSFTFTEAESNLISVEVGELFHKQAISQTVSYNSFLSNILVPKGRGKCRLIFNL